MDFQLLLDELRRVVTDILRVIPNIINGLILLAIGYLLAALVRWALTFALGRLGFDALMDRIGVAAGLRSIGVNVRLSRLLAQFVFVLLLLSFSATAMRVMGLIAIATLLEQILAYLPSIVGALIVFLVGGLAAKYVGDLVTRVGASNNLSYAQPLGRIIQSMITLFVVVLALGSLGVDTSILITVLTISVAAFGLAFAISLGLGARSLIRDILSSYYVRERFPVGRPIQIGDVQGEVSGIGSVNTVITTQDETVVIPNSTLIRATVRSPRTTTPEQSPPAPPTEP
jgi:small-conductance mechanosensitive channel